MHSASGSSARNARIMNHGRFCELRQPRLFSNMLEAGRSRSARRRAVYTRRARQDTGAKGGGFDSWDSGASARRSQHEAASVGWQGGKPGRKSDSMEGDIPWSSMLLLASKVSVKTSSYALIMGLALIIAPHSVFGLLFDKAAVSQGFVRFGGGLLTLFGLYYAGAGMGAQTGDGLRGFYVATILGRLLFVAFCILLYMFKQIGAGVLVFAGLNLYGALSMWHAIRQDQQLALKSGAT